MVVIYLGKNLLLKSVLGHCGFLLKFLLKLVEFLAEIKILKIKSILRIEMMMGPLKVPFM